jgi:hypothetical protein
MTRDDQGTLMAGASAQGALNATADDVHLSFLPMAHIMELYLQNYFLGKGCQIGYFGGDTLKLLEDAAVLKPTIFVAVPRLLNKVRVVPLSCPRSVVGLVEGCAVSDADAGVLDRCTTK